MVAVVDPEGEGDIREYEYEEVQRKCSNIEPMHDGSPKSRLPSS
jgi:hypothetical protein